MVGRVGVNIARGSPSSLAAADRAGEEGKRCACCFCVCACVCLRFCFFVFPPLRRVLDAAAAVDGRLVDVRPCRNDPHNRNTRRT